ncbi:TRAP transporter large permease [Siminovitchia acidinfaciens]|uniref:TRAP transporter large permease n=1 Tax=Siminovitchia acidinfaciens TaxID=2321395 RepID=A0A429XSX8_9BACI|nr:TRAP transporter large permease [Siminovitchia acidinfaciens]RST70305.1 TRAP transporter large permease [Siminovitchia acidinfaciens]
MTILTLFLSFFILMLIGVPIAVSLGFSALITMALSTPIPLSTIVQKAFTSIDSFTLLAVPFFILTGVLMGHGGISKRLLNLANVLTGFLIGGLAMVTVLASMFFAAISGSGPATVSAIGSIIIPTMKQQKYDTGFASAITAAAGSIGVIIPPSIPMIMFGIIGGVSIGGLFLAGIIPGILVGISLMLTAYLISKKNGYKGTGKIPTFKAVLKATNEAKLSLLVPVIILGGIYSGLFSPTESAVVGCVYALIVGGLVYKELSWKKVYESFAETAMINVTVIIIVSFSVSFAYLLTIERIPGTIATFLVGLTDNPIMILLLINLFLLVVGMFLDTISAIVIVTPILLPIATQIGLDPIHFGIIMITNLAIGYVTPPLGVNLFVASNIAKVSVERVIKGVLPFILAMIITVIMVILIPGLSMFLPNLMNK